LIIKVSIPLPFSSLNQLSVVRICTGPQLLLLPLHILVSSSLPKEKKTWVPASKEEIILVEVMPQLLYSSDTHSLKLDTTTLKHLINDALCGAECEVVAAIIGALYIS
jgi:hypothetical protein